MDSDLHSETMPVTKYSRQQGNHLVEPNDLDNVTRAGLAVEKPLSYEPPNSLVAMFSLLFGLDRALALALPCTMGAVLGWFTVGELNVAGLILPILSNLSLLIGINIFSEYNDYRFGLRPESKYYDDEPAFLGKNLIAVGLFRPGAVISLGMLFLAVGLLLTLILAFTVTDWPSIFFFAITGLLLAIYLLPPPWHGYLEWGVGEVGIVLGLGVIQVFSTYYAQVQMVDALPLLLGISLGFFSVLVLFSHSLIRQRHDWMIRKRTLAVALGDQKSVYMFIGLIVLAYTSLLLVIALTSLPLLLLLGLLTLPMAIGPFKQSEEILQTAENRYSLHQIMVRVTMVTHALLAILLIAM